MGFEVRPRLTVELAARFAGIALGHVTREYPHALTHVLDGPQDVRSPRDLHPIFFGSFDWHSCVHAYWMLARLLLLFPDMPQAGEIRSLFDSRLTGEAVAGECAYLNRPAARGFERPYGWAWFLKLAEAVRSFPDQPWSATLAPMTAIFGARFEDFLPKATYPVRAGTHFNGCDSTLCGSMVAIRQSRESTHGDGEAQRRSAFGLSPIPSAFSRQSGVDRKHGGEPGRRPHGGGHG
nr:DUF2891 family protein [uncultured Rhodopila sp.]